MDVDYQMRERASLAEARKQLQQKLSLGMHVADNELARAKQALMRTITCYLIGPDAQLRNRAMIEGFIKNDQCLST